MYTKNNSKESKFIQFISNVSAKIMAYEQISSYNAVMNLKNTMYGTNKTKITFRIEGV